METRRNGSAPPLRRSSLSSVRASGHAGVEQVTTKDATLDERPRFRSSPLLGVCASV